MQVRLMQKIDYFAGIPLCAGLSAWNKIRSLAFSQSKIEPKRVLFIELSEMGSAFLAYPTLKKAVERFGRENVFFLIFEKNRESVDLLEILPYENVITIPDNSFLTFSLGTLKALYKIRTLGVDTAIDMELFSRATSIISYLSGAVIRVGFDNFTDEGLYRGDLRTHRVLLNNHLHISHNFLALLEALDSDQSELPQIKKNVSFLMCDLPHLTPTQAEREKVWDKLAERSSRLSKDSKLIVMNPDPGLLSLRGWPVERYKELAEKLLSEHSDAFIICMGLPRSSSYAEMIFPSTMKDRCIDFCGGTSNLREVITLFNMSYLLITNDSGPGHLASLARVPAVVLFGPESPAKYCPLGDKVRSLFAGLACSPCYTAANHRHSICTNNRCLQAISVDEVHRCVNSLCG